MYDDVPEDGMCNHTYFENLPKLTEVYNFSSSPMIRECCHNNSNLHGYLHVDLCEVIIYFKQIFIFHFLRFIHPDLDNIFDQAHISCRKGKTHMIQTGNDLFVELQDLFRLIIRKLVVLQCAKHVNIRPNILG